MHKESDEEIIMKASTDWNVRSRFSILRLGGLLMARFRMPAYIAELCSLKTFSIIDGGWR
jgi:hypothetical protein